MKADKTHLSQVLKKLLYCRTCQSLYCTSGHYKSLKYGDVALSRWSTTEKRVQESCVDPACRTLCGWSPGVVPHAGLAAPPPTFGRKDLKECQRLMPRIPHPICRVQASQFLGLQRAALGLLVRCSELDQLCPHGSVHAGPSDGGQGVVPMWPVVPGGNPSPHHPVATRQR